MAKGSSPALTPEGRENHLISLAFDLAERQLREGTATAQVITYLLKLGSAKEHLEQEKLHRENLLLSAKVDNIEKGNTIEELLKAALNAMRHYKGDPDADVEDDYADHG